MFPEGSERRGGVCFFFGGLVLYKGGTDVGFPLQPCEFSGGGVASGLAEEVPCAVARLYRVGGRWGVVEIKWVFSIFKPPINSLRASVRRRNRGQNTPI